MIDLVGPLPTPEGADPQDVREAIDRVERVGVPRSEGESWSDVAERIDVAEAVERVGRGEQ